MRTTTTKTLTISIPCYADRDLFLLSQRTGVPVHAIALFFLSRKAGHARPRHPPLFLTQKAEHAQHNEK